jgi:hypothetical protein
MNYRSAYINIKQYSFPLLTHLSFQIGSNIQKNKRLHMAFQNYFQDEEKEVHSYLLGEVGAVAR